VAIRAAITTGRAAGQPFDRFKSLIVPVTPIFRRERLTWTAIVFMYTSYRTLGTG